MADTDKQGTWANTLLSKEEVQLLDEMVVENGSDRAKFIRLLIKQEYERRQQVKKTMDKLRAKGLLPH